MPAPHVAVVPGRHRSHCRDGREARHGSHGRNGRDGRYGSAGSIEWAGLTARRRAAEFAVPYGCGVGLWQRQWLWAAANKKG